MFIVHCPQTHPDQKPDTADLVQGEDVGEQVWQGVVGVPHRRHKEGRHSTGEDNDETGNNDDIEENENERVEIYGLRVIQNFISKVFHQVKKCISPSFHPVKYF